MLRIAIVEDENTHAKALIDLCARYSAENNEEVHTVHFDNPVQFLEKYRGDYDVVLMDILMPLMDGMECARRLREKDDHVILCFVTNMAQYAIRGYEVGAYDFIIKPVTYGEFSMKFRRIMRALKRRESATILITSRNSVKKVDIRDLYYVEVYNHSLVYHTSGGDFESYGKLTSLEEDERFRGFLRVSPSHLVNCVHISSVQEDALIVNDVSLPVSRRRRKECLEKMAAFVGGAGY